jgi:aminopeptidase N
MVYADGRLRLQGDPADYQYIMAHEIAHQWWYGLVGNDSIHEPWLDESLASYSAAIFLERAGGKHKGKALVTHWRHTYGRRTAQQPPVNSPALDFSNWLAYRSPVYYQGALFLHALREEIGDAAFFSLIRRYLATYRYRFATTEDFMRLAEAVSCRDLDELFEQWFKVGDNIAPTQCTLSPLERSQRIKAR